MENLQGKVAIVTGGASGIGNGIAKGLARAGCKLVIVDARQQAIDDALPYFKEHGYEAIGYQLDVTDREAYEKFADDVEAKLGNIHILVNNAGVAAGSGPAWTSSYNDWDFILGVNVTGVFNGIKIIVPRILKHGEEGHVVSTSSTGGAFAVGGSALYCITKYAVSGIMECLASDLVGTKVGASVLYPGPTNSNLGMSSQLVRPESLKDAPPPGGFAPPPPSEDGEAAPPSFPMMDFTKIFMAPEELGERVVRAIKRGDIFIWTHKEFKDGIRVRNEAILKAFPDEPDNELRYNTVKIFGTLMYNPVYEQQTRPGPPDWEKYWE